MAKSAWSASPVELLHAGPGFALADVDPDSTPGFAGGKSDGVAALEAGRAELEDLQERLWAESRFGGTRSLLLVIQAMDTAGKGGIVQHVMGGITPEGLHAYAFKKPTEQELAHDFLWRIRKQLPAVGMIGVFDRSHYEDVLVERVHKLSPAAEIESRYGTIVDFERQLVAAGTTIVKVMLHISPDEQKARLEDRLDRVDKQWKYNPGDLVERGFWPQYMEAYQRAVERTATVAAPWYVVPANAKWYARVAVQQILLETMRAMDLAWPAVDFDIDAEKKKLSGSSLSRPH